MIKRKAPFLLLAICTVASLFLLTVLRASPPDGEPAELVIQVQARLQEEGFEPGPADGIMGPQTRRALRAFQSEHGLKATGRLDKPTLEKLKIEGHQSFLEKVGSGLAAAGSTVGEAVKTGAEATAEGAAVGAKAAANAATVGAKAAANGSVAAAEATAAGGVAVAKAAQTAGEETADAFDEDSPNQELANRVRERLERHPEIPADKIQVVAEGPSTVRLIFDSNTTPTERNLAVVEAKRVSGAERVFIRLTQTG